MKKRVLSLFTALLMALCVMSASASAFAESTTPVWDNYAKNGSHKVSAFTFKISGNDYKYKVWYPKDIKSMKKCPVILYCNATGFNYESTPATVEPLNIAASHGYICLSNTDKNCGDGESMDAGMTKLIKLNKTKSSPLYGRVDLSRVALAGHSQGSICTMNLPDKNKFKNAKYYKAIFAASIPSPGVSNSPLHKVPYNYKSVTVPTFLVAGTGAMDADYICPLDSGLQLIKDGLKSDAYIVRIAGADHAETFEKSYPYMLAWFDYQLSGNALALTAFAGANPELQLNSAFQDFEFKIYKKKAVLNKAVAGKKSIRASWERVPSAAGYELQYSSSKSFKSAKTITVKKASVKTVSVKRLKAKKKYFVRVRTYKIIGNKTYYSKWSSAKTVKTK